MKPQDAKPTIRFRAKLTRQAAASWTLLTLPKNAGGRLPSHGGTRVEGTINGFPFRTALQANGGGSRFLRIDQAVQNGAGADAGDPVTVEITRVGDEPEIRVPMDLGKAIAAVPKARAMWAQITPMARRDWILWLSSAKLPETRVLRIKKACDMLASGKRRVCCFGGLNWLVKDHPAPGGTWLPLPNSKL